MTCQSSTLAVFKGTYHIRQDSACTCQSLPYLLPTLRWRGEVFHPLRTGSENQTACRFTPSFQPLIRSSSESGKCPDWLSKNMHHNFSSWNAASKQWLRSVVCFVSIRVRSFHLNVASFCFLLQDCCFFQKFHRISSGSAAWATNGWTIDQRLDSVFHHENGGRWT